MSLAERLAAAREERDAVMHTDVAVYPSHTQSDSIVETDFTQHPDVLRHDSIGRPLHDDGKLMRASEAEQITSHVEEIREGFGPYKSAHENQLWTLPEEAPQLDTEKSGSTKFTEEQKAKRVKINEEIKARREARAEIIEAGKAHYQEKKAAEKAQRSEKRQGIGARLRGLFGRNRNSEVVEAEPEFDTTPTTANQSNRAEREHSDEKHTNDEHDVLQKREEKLHGLDELRTEYLRRVAGRARRAAHLKKDFSRKGVDEAQKAYETHRNDIFESELEYLRDELGMLETDGDSEAIDIDHLIAAFAFDEQRKLAKELHKLRLEATGNYEIVEHTRESQDGKSVAAWTELEAKKRGPLDKFYEWYGSVNNGGKWYSKGAWKKAGAMGVIGGVAGLGIGLVAAPLTAGAIAGIGGGVLVSRITKAYMSTHIKRKSEDKNITHADARRWELLNKLGDGKNEVEMTNLISGQTKTEVFRNRKRTAAVVGATAIGGALGGGLIHGIGLPNVNFPNISNPFGNPFNDDAPKREAWGNNDTTSHENDGVDTDEPAEDGVDAGDGDAYVDKPHDGIKANGEIRIPKHGKLGESFRVEQGSGQIREIQQYAAAHNYEGIDTEKATEIWEHLKNSPLTDGNEKLIDLRGSDDTYRVGSDVRLSRRDAAAEWGNRAIERALREELEKEELPNILEANVETKRKRYVRPGR